MLLGKWLTANENIGWDANLQGLAWKPKISGSKRTFCKSSFALPGLEV
jgi:hypothetical protein